MRLLDSHPTSDFGDAHLLLDSLVHVGDEFDVANDHNAAQQEYEEQDELRTTVRRHADTADEHT